MQKAKYLGAVVAIGVAVALTYYLFEASVHNAIHFVWYGLFDTESQRWLVPILCVAITTAYFAIQHLLDPKNEHIETHGLGHAPKATLTNFVNILIIGFLSLLAGASLGPEAVLVPACIVIATYLGKRFTHQDSGPAMFGLIGFVALFTAFFHSFFIGMLSLVLVKRQFNIKLSLPLITAAAIGSATTYLVLEQLTDKAYVNFPAYTWNIELSTLLMLTLIGLGGYLSVYLLSATNHLADNFTVKFNDRIWWQRALLAGGVLSVIYLLGGNLVEFTGNESIVPLFSRVQELGVIGLLWVILIKIVAVSWSRASGYRGGLIFPMVFVVAAITAVAQLVYADFNLIYGIIAGVIGLFVADRKVKALV